jgi:hypothetical protein
MRNRVVGRFVSIALCSSRVSRRRSGPRVSASCRSVRSDTRRHVLQDKGKVLEINPGKVAHRATFPGFISLHFPCEDALDVAWSVLGWLVNVLFT